MFTLAISKELRAHLVERIQTFYAEERSEQIGSVAADQLLAFMIQTVGPLAYNKAIGDARGVLNERMAAMEDELYSLEKPILQRGSASNGG